jgi:hypothetical protein
VSLGTSHYIATVSYLVPGQAASIFLGHTNANNLNYDASSGGRLLYNAGGTQVDVIGAWPVSQQVLISVERNGLSLTSRTNGVEGTATLGANTDLTLSHIGLRSGLTSFTWKGTIQEILIYDSVPENIELIEGNIAWGWSV